MDGQLHPEQISTLFDFVKNINSFEFLSIRCMKQSVFNKKHVLLFGICFFKSLNGNNTSGSSVYGGVTNNCNGNTLFNDHSFFTVGSGYLAPVGIVLNQTPNTTAKTNTIQNCENGIEFYQNAGTTSRVRYNTFQNLTYGLVSAMFENPLTSTFPYANSSGQVNLATECNSFSTCEYGWVGTGTYPNQGSSGTECGNTFSSVNKWNTCVVSPTSTYFKLNFSNPHDPYGGNTTGSVILDGNTITSTASCFAANSAPQNDCLAPGVSRLSIRDNEEINLFIYPNPFDKYLDINLHTKLRNLNIAISDITGKVLIRKEIANTTEVERLNLEALNSGVYIIQVIYNNTIFKTQHILKVGND
ncbi:MAG: T9SS type A sorting domain-containing protein [Bacteroidetes bacterium]|nr:T9SS type A sorting domain-containing protein [Bacteroidota bacterium]